MHSFLRMFMPEKWWWFGLRACLYCGSLERQADGLCGVCSEDLWSWQSETRGLFKNRLQKTLEVCSLFYWVPGQQEVLSRLLHALKGPGGSKLWENYAEEFWRRHLQSYAESHVPAHLLIPSPAASSERDHAAFFTQGLAALSGAKIYSCLKKPAVSSQKRKNRAQRLTLALEWSEGFTKADFLRQSASKKVIFVDDVVTTGATALAAWKTLGKPRDFAVWSLAYRGLPCGASMDLI